MVSTRNSTQKSTAKSKQKATGRHGYKFPQWDKLPGELQQHVMKNLTNSERFEARICSKQMNALVNTIPITINHLTLQSCSQFRTWWLQWLERIPPRRCNNKKSCEGQGISMALNVLLNFFNHPQSFLGYLILNNGFTEANGQSLMKKFVEEAKRRNMKLCVGNVTITFSRLTRAKLVREFLELFDEKDTNEMTLIEPPDDVINAMRETKQWENCSKICLSNYEIRQRCSLRYFMHFDDVYIERIHAFELEEVFEFVKNYCLKPLTTSHKFHLHSRYRGPYTEILNLLDSIPGCLAQAGTDSDKRHFLVEDPELVLKVVMTDNLICGSVSKRR